MAVSKHEAAPSFETAALQPPQNEDGAVASARQQTEAPPLGRRFAFRSMTQAFEAKRPMRREELDRTKRKRFCLRSVARCCRNKFV